MIVAHYSITDAQLGQPLGDAIVCLEVRYAGIAWRDDPRVVRRAPTPATWIAAENERRLGLNGDPLSPNSHTVAILIDSARRFAVSIHPVSSDDLPIDRAEAIAALDAKVRAFLP